MSWTNQTAPTGALLAQRSLTGRAVQSASPAMFSVEAPAAAAIGTWLGLACRHVPMPLGRNVGAEGLPLPVAVGAGAEAAGDLNLAQVSGDSPGWLTVHVAETVEAVTAASRNTVQKRAEQIVHHATS